MSAVTSQSLSMTQTYSCEYWRSYNCYGFHTIRDVQERVLSLPVSPRNTLIIQSPKAKDRRNVASSLTATQHVWQCYPYTRLSKGEEDLRMSPMNCLNHYNCDAWSCSTLCVQTTKRPVWTPSSGPQKPITYCDWRFQQP